MVQQVLNVEIEAERAILAFSGLLSERQIERCMVWQARRAVLELNGVAGSILRLECREPGLVRAEPMRVRRVRFEELVVIFGLEPPRKLRRREQECRAGYARRFRV